jgi:hypothetical protein
MLIIDDVIVLDDIVPKQYQDLIETEEYHLQGTLLLSF